MNHHIRPGADDRAPGHPSQAEGEDADDAPETDAAYIAGHPSQAEGDDDADDSDAQ